ncbi:hypothetical protein U4Z70_20330 [Escherichia coli]|nr:hypothetical protein [Escherichia coli]
MSIKNDGHYFCRAGGNRPDGLNEPVTDRPGVAIFLECDSVDEAMNVMAEFPLAKAGLLSFECIPLGSFINWENLFADEFKNKE